MRNVKNKKRKKKTQDIRRKTQDKKTQDIDARHKGTKLKLGNRKSFSTPMPLSHIRQDASFKIKLFL